MKIAKGIFYVIASKAWQSRRLLSDYERVEIASPPPSADGLAKTF
jgi:hypothetical protein